MKKLIFSKETIKQQFEAFNDLNVLIIGDVMIDSYLWGKVNRISPEAPVPIVTIDKREKRLGGAANVALNVQSLGANPILCSVIGVDYEGNEFIELLKKQKLTIKGILKSRDRQTTTKTRVIGNNHQLLRVDEEMELDVSTRETENLLLLINSLLQQNKIDVIIFEDYNKGCITAKLITKVVEMAKKKGIPTVVDPKRKNFMAYKGVTMFKPNLKELKEGLKVEFSAKNITELQKVVTSFRTRQKIEQILLTLSEQGVCVNSKTYKEIFPAHIRDIADVSGAGDTVVSVASLCLALKMHPALVANISNLAGGLVCEQVGVVPIQKKKLLEETLNLPFIK